MDIITIIDMKKSLQWIVALCLLAGLVGCAKQVEVPKLQAKTLTIAYTDQADFDYSDLVDLSGFTDEQIAELEKNGEIDTSELVYDHNGDLAAGTYDVQVSYYEDVVDCMVTVVNDTLPVFNDVSEVDVTWSYCYWDFNQNISATSPLGLPVTMTYDTSAIDFYTVGDYKLVATATDSSGGSATKTITVHIKG